MLQSYIYIFSFYFLLFVISQRVPKYHRSWYPFIKIICTSRHLLHFPRMSSQSSSLEECVTLGGIKDASQSLLLYFYEEKNMTKKKLLSCNLNFPGQREIYLKIKFYLRHYDVIFYERGRGARGEMAFGKPNPLPQYSLSLKKFVELKIHFYSFLAWKCDTNLIWPF